MRPHINYQMVLIMTTFLALPMVSYSEETTFALVDKACRVTAASENSLAIKTIDGAKGVGICRLESKDKYKCSYGPNDKSSAITETNFKYLDINKHSAILTNNDGNIKLFINLKKKTFNLGQTVAIPEQGIVTNKYCTGLFIDSKEISQLMKDESKKERSSSGK